MNQEFRTNWLWRDPPRRKQEAADSLSYQVGLLMFLNTCIFCTNLGAFHRWGMGKRMEGSNRTKNSIHSGYYIIFLCSYYRIKSTVMLNFHWCCSSWKGLALYMKIKRKGHLKYNNIVLKIKKTSKSKDKTKALLSTLLSLNLHQAIIKA